MGTFKTINGDLIKLALDGEFDVIAHGCNCMCTQGAGIAKQMVETFDTNCFPSERIHEKEWDYTNDDWFEYETGNRGDINKLGNIEYELKYLYFDKLGSKVIALNHNPYSDAREVPTLFVVNAYTQYNYGKNHEDGDIAPVDLSAIVMCMKKINHIFKGKRIGLPKIGAGLGGGNWEAIEQLIKTQLKDCDVTIVNYVP